MSMEKLILVSVLLVAVLGAGFIFLTDKSAGQAMRMKSLPGDSFAYADRVAQKNDFSYVNKPVQRSDFAYQEMQTTDISDVSDGRYCPQPTKPEQFCFDKECSKIIELQRSRDTKSFELLKNYLENSPTGLAKQRNQFAAALFNELSELHTDMSVFSESVINDQIKTIKDNEGYIDDVYINGNCACIDAWGPDPCFKLTPAGLRNKDESQKIVDDILQKTKACTQTSAEVAKIQEFVDFSQEC